jgi:hypothetical protein
MNGLVAYDSSSDDDAEPVKAPRAAVGGATNSASLAHVAPAKNGVDTDETESAMVGPSMPTEITGGSSMEDLDDLPADVSEQDLVRHLTQATHSMKAIPPSPPGSPNPATDARLKRFLALKATGMHFNEDLAKKNSFRNPALLSNLMERTGLSDDDQYANSISRALYQPADLPGFAYKEELARSQQRIRGQQATRKKQAAAVGKRTIEFTSATSSQTSTPGSVRKGTGS